MIHIEHSLLDSYPISRLFSDVGRLINFKDDWVFHSPEYREKDVPVDEVYGGDPAPYDVTVRESWCFKNNMKTGALKCSNTKNHYLLIDGPSDLSIIFGWHQFIGAKDLHGYPIDNKMYFDAMPEGVKRIFESLKCDSTGCFHFDENVRLLNNCRIVDTGRKVGNNSWSVPIFLRDGKECNFEELLRQNMK